eukprot:g12546.t1
MHAAWVSAASLVNLNLLGKAYDLSSDAQLWLAVLSELVAFGSGTFTGWKYKDAAFPLVTAWALWAIGRNPQNQRVWGGPHQQSTGSLQLLSQMGQGMAIISGLLGLGLALASSLTSP